jgi:hypothetical protein
MTPKLTPQEIEAINREAETEYPDILIEERGSVELWEMYEFNDMQEYKREAYAVALTSERLKHKAEIQAYREALEKASGLLSTLMPKEINTDDTKQMAIYNVYHILKQTLNQFK